MKEKETRRRRRREERVGERLEGEAGLIDDRTRGGGPELGEGKKPGAEADLWISRFQLWEEMMDWMGIRPRDREKEMYHRL